MRELKGNHDSGGGRGQDGLSEGGQLSCESGEHSLGRGTRRCKGPGAGKSLVCCRKNAGETDRAPVQKVRVERRKIGSRESWGPPVSPVSWLRSLEFGSGQQEAMDGFSPRDSTS